MKTYNKLTKEEKHSLIKKGVLNGCGAAKGFDFDPYIDLVEQSLGLGLLFDYDMKDVVCYPHDYAYATKTKTIDRVVADLQFGINLFKVLRSYEFSLLNCISISFITTSVVLIKGGKPFKKAKKINTNK